MPRLFGLLCIFGVLARSSGGEEARPVPSTGKEGVRVLDESGFVPLFDGKTLDGWTIQCLPKDQPLAKAAWTVDLGTILANTIGHKEHFYIMIGLQIHSHDELKLWFKDIRIKSL